MKIFALLFFIYSIETVSIPSRKLYVYHPYIPNVKYYKGRKMMIRPPAPPPKTAGNLNESILIVDTFAPQDKK